VYETCSCFVLAGGKSSRFGSNKSLAMVGTQHMAVVVANNLRSAFGGEVRLVGADPFTSSEIGLATILGPREGSGPLGAIVDAMESSESELIAFAPNDTPYFSSECFTALLLKIEESESDAVVVVDDSDSPRTHWLLSVWRKDPCLSVLRDEYESGVRSVHAAVNDLKITSVRCDAALVRNINTVSDMLDQGTI
jgi:molybdopterin-guanine dinucleotide biosynthesis protein A